MYKKKYKKNCMKFNVNTTDYITYIIKFLSFIYFVCLGQNYPLITKNSFFDILQTQS